MTCPTSEYCAMNGCSGNGCSRRALTTPIQPAVVPDTETVPVVGIVVVLGLLIGGLAALVGAGLSIAGGIGAILGVFS